MIEQIAFAPMLPWAALAVAAALVLGLVAFALWRGLAGWALRALAALALLIALADPSWKQEERDYLTDIAFLVIDESASQGIDIRPEQMAQTVPALEAALTALSRAEQPLETRIVRVADSIGDGPRGTRVATALAAALAEVSPDRVAGAILLSDGRVHDADAFEGFPGPVHTVLTGSAQDWDRRLLIETAPSFAIVGEPLELQLRVEDLGPVPASAGGQVDLSLSIDGEAELALSVPVNTPVTVPLELPKAGLNVIQVQIAPASGELTERNNAAVLTINGIRDRLRVLLVSGEPYAGERTWRNLLKADSAVDLVHFTILRPPEKQDGVPVFELSLIAFPTRELFMEKVDEFDLIIFDRYRRRGVLPSLYLDNVARYVRDGGAVLIASGPAFAGAESLSRTPLAAVLPAQPTARVLEEGFTPQVSDIGTRHPVTRDLEALSSLPAGQDGGPGWGRWFRQIEMEQNSGVAVMEGPDARPLLILDRPGEGRIAMLASDHAWLWSRGFEGGGPQSELLRRLAHWLMQEPELEEEVLVAEPDGAGVTITRRSLSESIGDLSITTPSGETRVVPMVEMAPGTWQARIDDAEDGIYRLSEGALEAVAALGPAAPIEFENPVSSSEIVGGFASATNGGVLRLEDGVPGLRRVREGRVAAGRNWLGLPRREAYTVADIKLTSLAPGWLMLLLAGLLSLAAWRVEGR